MVEMTDKQGRKLKNYADWSAISREVKRNINEGCGSFKIRVGGFSVAFSESDRYKAVHEAAARLRRPAPVDDDLLKMARDIDKLRAKLKVAEDALDSAWMYADKLPHQWPLPERVRTKMRNAIAAIRGEGGNDAH